MPWKSQGEKRKCEKRKGTGSREREKEKDGNGKDERNYPLENILFDTNIAGLDARLFIFSNSAVLNLLE